jgi:integrase
VEDSCCTNENGKEQRAPFNSSACAIIESPKRVTNSDFPFLGVKAGSHLSTISMLMALRRMNRSDLTMHGFRSTFRNWVAESTSYPREVCGQALAHNRQDKAEAAYFRTDLFDKRRAMMEEWAEYAYSINADKKKIIGP